MTTITVGWLAPDGQWDQNLLGRLFSNRVTGYEFEHVDGYPQTDGCVLVIPGRYWHLRTREISTVMSQYRWVLAMRTSDEEDKFDISKVRHRNHRWWVQTPKTDVNYGDARLFGVGFPPHFNNLPTTPPTYRSGVFLAAQATHARRTAAFTAVGLLDADKVTLATDGYARGMSRSLYVDEMTSCILAPAPAGPQTPDTFRLYEALESHAVPVADDITPGYPSVGYWNRVCPGAPFPVITNYSDFSVIAMKVFKAQPDLSNRVAAWWMQYKYEMARWLGDDIANLSGLARGGDDITVVVPTSPIRSHPDTAIIEHTVASIRHHLPAALIILTFDGVRAEQQNMRCEYEEYIRRVLWRADHDRSWGQVLPFVFDKHVHQVGMMRAIIDHIRTPLLMYVEHDMPLRTDREIDLDGVVRFIRSGRSDLVRFYLRDEIPQEHGYLMHGIESDAPYLRTSQWSQNVHVATVDLYRRALTSHFSPDAKSFIEDGLHGPVAGSYPSDDYRLHIYHPSGDIRCLQHLDGRGAESKFEREQIF